ncbi:MAG TPA: Rho termination factor N-terminal domain-containing protein, partial [Acidimicrobiia bacterium]|nr:Rho termination factor N-terminal domain-containing protein [Acidimicrobiia bacterium]
MTSRAKLQEKNLEELRVIAGSLGIDDHESLQKSKLIAAILDSDGFEVSDAPQPVELPAIEEHRDTDDDAKDSAGAKTDDGEAASSGSKDPGSAGGSVDTAKQKPQDRRDGADSRGGSGSGGSDGDGDDEYDDAGNRRRRRRRRGGGGGGGGGEREFFDESEAEVREGILDILPENYGFLRVTGYLPGDKDVYVSASQVRKFGLRKGDVIKGPIRPARAQEKFPAIMRIESVNGMSVEEARRRPKFGDLTPLFPDQRLRLEISGQQ